MPTQVTNYQCPACTGPLHFVGSSGKLECDYCGSKFDVAEIEALYAEKEQKAADAQKTAEEKQTKTAPRRSADSGLRSPVVPLRAVKLYSCCRSGNALFRIQAPPLPGRGSMCSSAATGGE